MAPSHNVVLLVDTVEPDAKSRVRLVCLRLLNFLTCRAGLGQVRWSYRFLHSQGGRCRPPRRSDLRELAPRGWDEFEEELEACWERARQSRACQQSSSRAGLTHTALMETLADFQWDRPDISSPTKPTMLRGRKGKKGLSGDEALKAESSSDCGNAVFLVSPCPHTASQLGHFSGSPGLQHDTDRLLPLRLQHLLRSKRVTLHWLDTTDWAQVWNLSEHSGYWTMVELMKLVGGRVLPSEVLLSSNRHFTSSWFGASDNIQIPCDSVLNYMICNESEYRLLFPQENAVLFFSPPGVANHWECPVTLEPISVNQKQLKRSTTIKLRGIVQHWRLNQTHSVNVETWILQNSSKDGESCQFSQLLHTLLSRRLHMSADIFTEDALCPSTGVLTPLSENAAILTMMCNNEACELNKLFLCGAAHEQSEDFSANLSDVVSSILTNISTTYIEDVCVSDHTLPEWINRELAQNDQWSSSVVEKWYSLSGSSGVSSFLMDSFRLIHAGSTEDEQSDSFKCHQEITQCLSEYYQMKSNEDPGIAATGEKSKKRLPCTPVRQKMKSMPRALQMLNAARLNVKAQKSQPDNLSALPNNKKNPQIKKRSNKTEARVKALKLTGFKSEEELYTQLYDDYQKAVSGKEDSLITCSKNSIATIKYYMKSYHKECDEMDCVHKIKTLLKTSKAIRQFYGDNQKKETKLRECQIQVFLRLEMCAQCPVIQTHTDELEQIIEEVTDMLRIICLTEDPLFLTKFLDENVLVEYIAVMPKILGEIYYGLGRRIPENLALLLPADCDDSVTHESISTVPSQQSVSRVPSVSQLVTEAEQLEELRTRSAKKRRTCAVARHRSLAESSQVMRQIEIPRKLTNKENLLSNPVVMIEKLKYSLPAQQKDMEATKARRNLFENQTPTKKCHKMPRSQSVSAVEGLKRKRCRSSDDTKEYKLLTKKVSETPLRKQTSNRLLYKQIKGRHSESTSSIGIVEESPEKEIKEIDLRRSPRIKQLSIARKNSFYASQPKSRNVERVHSFTKRFEYSGNSTNTEIKSPKHILFGEVLKVGSPPAAKRRLSDVERNSKTRGKTNKNMPAKVLEDFPERNRMPQKSPHTPKTPSRMSNRLKTPSKSSSERKKAARNLCKLFSPSKLREPIESVSPTKASSPDKFISPVTKTREQTIAQLDEIPQALGCVMTPTRYSSMNRQQDLSNTPTKSPYKLLESAVGSTPPRYDFRTPQKPVKPPVSRTSVPKYEKESGFHIFQCANECTPEKQHFSTVKHNVTAWATSSNHTPKQRISNFSVKASGLENISALLDNHCTPKKSSLENSHYSHSLQFKSPPEATSKASDVQENAEVHAYQSTSEFAIDSCQTSAPGQITPTAAPVPREILLSPCSKDALPFKLCSPKCRVEPIVLCEKLNLSSFESTVNSESFVSSSQTEESIDAADGMVLPMEPSELKLNVLITQKPSDCGLQTELPMECGENKLSSSPYCLRCTPDRRQREAAARLQPPQIPTQFSTPKSRKCLLPSGIPTYEVALEMQPSGLPKLRFKRTDSNSTVDLETGTKIESPHVLKKKKGDESPFTENWCNKHTTKLDTTCVSPCLRTCHATPGKYSFQTLICQSYTPNRGTSNTTSPPHIDSGVPWTLSPKFKDRNGSDAINNWPRKKKASALNGGLKGDKIQEYSDLPSAGEDIGATASKPEANNKALEDFELEGVSKLQEKSPILQWQGTSDIEPFSLTSRKRSLDVLSPTKDPQHSKRPRTVSRKHETINQGNTTKGRTEINSPYKSLSSNLSTSQHSSCDDEVFSDPGFTPPNKVVNTLSTSGLLTLTHSPLLYRSKTPSSKRNMQGVESEHSTPTLQRQTRQKSDSDDSPFSKGAPVRTSYRTYSRKRLIP